LVATPRFGPIVVFKLMTTFWDCRDIPKSYARLVDVVSQDELVDTKVVKITFVAPL
jgi:hypothetical protein